MKNLASLNKYLLKYRGRLFLGLLFVTLSSIFAAQPAGIIQQTVDEVRRLIEPFKHSTVNADIKSQISHLVLISGLELLGLALLRGIFMFFMRQTIIVMSRHIEYDQKAEIYNHYQELDTHFYKTHFTGDLMNRLSEDVSRVRMYTGPSIMYFSSMLVLVITCIWGMVKVNLLLTLCVIIPFPLLALSIFYVNKIIFKKSGKIQAQLSDLTTTAQESYSGIRVIKSFVQEMNMLRFFQKASEDYKGSAVNLSLTEAIYFPAINMFIGFSMLATILLGGWQVIHGSISVGNILGFVYYINLMMFPISSIGMVASMTQRAGASQKRIDEFLNTEPEIKSPGKTLHHEVLGNIDFNHTSFTYAHTGIHALKDLSLHIKAGQKVAIIGKTGSGKSTIAHLLLRMYDPQVGDVTLDGVNIKDMNLQDLRRQIGYAPQEAYLFSDTVYNNIKFGRSDATEEEIKHAVKMADLEKDIAMLNNGYETMIGERGVMLSGGQKQRLVLARALLKNSKIILLDQSLSAVDTRTENVILHNLLDYLKDKTAIVITHRIFTSWTFDQIVVMDDGVVVEHGTHAELMELNGRYAKLYRHQTLSNNEMAQ